MEKPLIAKFKISKEDVGNRYTLWVRGQKGVPKDFDISKHFNNIKGIYVPIFLFDVSAESSWHGEDYHSEYHNFTNKKYNIGTQKYEDYVDSKEYEVPNSVTGNHYSEYLLPIGAYNGIKQLEIEKLAKNLKVSDLQSYDESYLNGSDVWPTDLDKTKALEICNNRIKELESKACELEVDTLFGCSTKKATINNVYYALFPIFVLSYKYKDNYYHNFMDGLAGKGLGSIPYKKNRFEFDLNDLSVPQRGIITIAGTILLIIIINLLDSIW